MDELQLLNKLPDEISDEQLPEVITQVLGLIATLEEKLISAVHKGNQAKDSAEAAKKKSAGVFKKKEAIEAIQSATVDLAEAQASALDAQQLSFEYQKHMAEITKYLFGLGCKNIAINRAIIQGLQDGIDGKTSEQFGELARQHMVVLVKQLKDQEDIMHQTRVILNRLRNQEERINSQQTQIQTNVARQARIDSAQDAEIEEQAQKDIEHDNRIQAIVEANTVLETRIIALEQTAVNLSGELDKKTEELRRYTDSKIESASRAKADRWICYLSASVGVVSLILSVLALLLK